MIRFTLKCDNDHAFESWFKSSDAFETLNASKMVNCSVCGSSEVKKTLMAPAVRTEKAKPLTGEKSETEQAVEKLRKEVETNSDYVGDNFASEARKMHNGETAERSIYGEAKPADAISLIEDGIPVLPLPFAPRKQTN